MEPIKRDGMIREQINLEDKIRRQYPSKWGALTAPAVNEFYNPDNLCRELRKKYKKDMETCPYEYDDKGTGESHFVSKEMYNELAKCRCGRARTEIHIIKCLQRAQPDYGQFPGDGTTTPTEGGNKSRLGGVPATSSGVYGWPRPTRQSWELERSTHYISPKNTIPGGRIDDMPYSNVFIG